jgi:hypothetical protein
MGRRRNPPAPPQYQAPQFSPIELQKLGELTKLDLEELGSYTKAFPDFLQQKQYLGDLQSFTSDVNRTFQDSLESSAPGVREGVRTLGETAASQLRGEIPQDVEDAIFRTGAMRDMSSGLGSDSRRSRNLTARDLGLTSLDMQNQGVSTLQSALTGAAGLNPVQAMDQLFGTADVLARQDANVALRNQETSFNTNLENYRTTYNNDIENQQRYYNTNIKNQQATANTNVANANASNRYNYDMMKFQQSQQGMFGLGGMLGTIAGGALGFATGGPIGAIGGAVMGSNLGGGIQSAASGQGFGGLASGMVSGLGFMAGAGVSQQNPFGLLSAIGRSFGSPGPASNYGGTGFVDSRVGLRPGYGGGGRMGATLSGRRLF